MSTDSAWKALGLAVVTGLGLGCGAEEPSAANEAPALMISTAQPLMYGGHDYLFIRATRAWTQAGALCDSLGYGLVTVNDAEEEAFLRRFDRGGSWWLGTNDIQTEGRWVWRDGTSTYSNWASGEPNDSGASEDCGAANAIYGRWNDVTCALSLYVVCESKD